MTAEPGKVSTWTLRLLVYGGAAAGIGLLLGAVLTDDPPRWWWWAGIPLTLLCGSLAGVWIRFRLRHRSPEARQRAIDDLGRRRDDVGRPLDQSKIAHGATKHKNAILRSGVDATAVITFLADGHRANEFQQLVYLELEVTVPGAAPYVVKTGEYLTAASAGSVAPGRHLRVKVDAAQPERVAVDWERSLRLE